MRECALIGQAVVSRSDKTGVYHLGMVRDRVAGCRNYLIEWADQSLEIQVRRTPTSAMEHIELFYKNLFFKNQKTQKRQKLSIVESRDSRLSQFL